MKKHSEFISNLGLAVQFFRLQKNMTQEELAYKINKSEDTISYIERGKITTRLDTLIDICEVCEISILELFQFNKITHTTKQKAFSVANIMKILATLDEQDAKICEDIITSALKLRIK
jgi:DNA-binding XRE family transcriptional regulator